MEWLDRKPLQRALPEPKPFPVDWLGPLQPVVETMAGVIKAPVALCANSALAATALAVQAHRDIDVDGRCRPISEFFITVGISGERKSETDRVVLWPHYQRQEELSERYVCDKQSYDNDMLAYNASRKAILADKKNRNYDARRAELKKLGPEPHAPIGPALVCSEPTLEGLTKMLATGQPSIGLFSDEGGQFIGGHAMNQDNQMKTAAGLSGLWDGKPINRVRAGDENLHLNGRRVSLHLMAQPLIALAFLSNGTLIDQGLLSRCLVTFPTTTAGTRMYEPVNLAKSPEVTDYDRRILEILRAEPPLAIAKKNELDPPALELTPEAKAIWIDFHNAVEKQLANNGRYAEIRGFASKAPEHALRLASILALYVDLDCRVLDKTSIERGIGLAAYYLSEARRLFAAGMEDQHLALAQQALDWMRQKNEDSITVQEVYQKGPRPVRTAQAARRIMAILVEHGEAMPYGDDELADDKPHLEAWWIRLE